MLLNGIQRKQDILSKHSDIIYLNRFNLLVVNKYFKTVINKGLCGYISRFKYIYLMKSTSNGTERKNLCIVDISSLEKFMF